jgi:membrane protease YdiL (CAAX protease family)
MDEGHGVPTTLAIAKWIRNLPQGAEVAVVIALCFGPVLVLAVAALARGSVPPLTNERAAAGIAYELAAGGAAAAFLAVRGWNRKQFRMSWRPLAVLVGFLLGRAYVVFSTIALVAVGRWLAPSPERLLRPAGSTALLLLFLTIDAVFEEVFANAYVVQALERLGARHAIVWSAALRVAFSIYQGALACILIFAFGAAAAWIFGKYGRLSIPIVAHVAANAAMILG